MLLRMIDFQKKELRGKQKKKVDEIILLSFYLNFLVFATFYVIMYGLHLL